MITQRVTNFLNLIRDLAGASTSPVPPSDGMEIDRYRESKRRQAEWLCENREAVSLCFSRVIGAYPHIEWEVDADNALGCIGDWQVFVEVIEGNWSVDLMCRHIDMQAKFGSDPVALIDQLNCPDLRGEDV